MAVSVDGLIACSASGQLSGAAWLGDRDLRIVKFCNGELIGKKVKLTHLRWCIKKGSVRPQVNMVLTANVAGEPK
ncbi:Clathrin assembly protein complex 2 beta large chain, partial [Sarracenia purpurea var. burkii]